MNKRQYKKSIIGLLVIEIEQDLEERLCSYCPLPEGSNEMKCYSGIPTSCESSHCPEAYENYLEEIKYENLEILRERNGK